MTREEAKHIVDVAFSVPQAIRRDGEDRTYHQDEISEAKNMAIQALSQEPCDDAIDRAEAQTEIMMSKSITAFDRDLWIRTKDAVHILRELPPVTQKSGKWIKMFLTDTGDIDGQCSECGFIHKFIDGHTAQYNYCPNCSAKMESEDKE